MVAPGDGSVAHASRTINEHRSLFSAMVAIDLIARVRLHVCIAGGHDARTRTSVRNGGI
jgi:hypothetical protein